MNSPTNKFIECYAKLTRKDEENISKLFSKKGISLAWSINKTLILLYYLKRGLWKCKCKF